VAEASLADLAGGDAAENAAITKGILSGEAGPKRDIALVNAAAAIVAADLAAGFDEGMIAAAASIDSGAATRVLESVISIGSKLASAGNQ
jgi:anthranilate phosphoribosyltransferase